MLSRSIIGAAAAAVLVAIPSPAAADNRVALAPLSTLGEETDSRETRKARAVLEAAIAAVPGHAAVSARELDRTLRRAKRRDLRACDGETQCLAQLGKLVDAPIVVYGELGGLGDAQVVYLKAIDAGSGRELRSTTLELGGVTDVATAARGAAFRLLAPDRYVGRLVPEIDVEGATIYVDGTGMATSPSKPIPLPVGTHALRVTHPEYRDYVRFVEIGFESETPVDIDLMQYPIVQRDVASNRNPGGAANPNVIYRGQEETPWYRRWYTVAGASAAVLIGSAVVVGLLVNGLDVDGERTIDRP